MARRERWRALTALTRRPAYAGSRRRGAGRDLDRLDDVVVAGATADVALEPGADLGFASASGSSAAGRQPPSPCPACRTRTAGRAPRGTPPARDAARCRLARPSMVVTLAPSACSASVVQLLTELPSTWTTHAPHWLVSHPTCVPVSARFLRRKSTSSVFGATSARDRLAVHLQA